MRATMTGNPMIAIRATVRLVRAAPGPVRLCRVLVDAWLRRLERRIEDDLRWFDHDGVSDDFRPASRRSRGAAGGYPGDRSRRCQAAARRKREDGDRLWFDWLVRCIPPSGSRQPSGLAGPHPLNAAAPSERGRLSHRRLCGGNAVCTAVPGPRTQEGPGIWRRRSSATSSCKFRPARRTRRRRSAPRSASAASTSCSSARNSTRVTQNMEPGMPVPVVITAYADRTFSFITKTPPNTYFLKKAAKIDKGSQTVGKGAPVGQRHHVAAARDRRAEDEGHERQRRRRRGAHADRLRAVDGPHRGGGLSDGQGQAADEGLRERRCRPRPIRWPTRSSW